MHAKPAFRIFAIAAGATVLAWAVSLAAALEVAEPPEFTDADVEPFFGDARNALVGERPAAGADEVKLAPGENADQAPERFAWSRIIDSEALATEVKRIAVRFGPALTSPTDFKSGGYHECRRAAGELAVFMAVIDQYDGEVRWHVDAAALRDRAAHVVISCSQPTDEGYADAMRLRDELNELIRGGSLGERGGSTVASWSQLVSRPVLMLRMERSLRDAVRPQLADSATFAKAAVDVRHEAMVLAVLAEVIARPEYEFWDDATYVDYARMLGQGAADLTQSAADGDYESARRAGGVITNACSTCHDGYQG